MSWVYLIEYTRDEFQFNNKRARSLDVPSCRDVTPRPVLSAQSKETAFVKDSSDDLWFLDDDDDVAAAAAVTIEIQANEADPPFAEEYEVESEAGDSAGNSDDMLSSSTQVRRRAVSKSVQFSGVIWATYRSFAMCT